MNGKAPPYVRLPAKAPIRHEWDDDDPYALLPRNDPEIEERLWRIADFGKLVFSLGCAEWVVAALDAHFDSERAWLYVDACWAYAVSERYALPPELDDDEWQGPILGPVCLALTTVVNTRYGFDEDNAEIDGAFAEKVALHVVTDETAFSAWRDAVLDRLLACCPADPEARRGPRVPRHLLDPRIEVEREQWPELLADTLRQLRLEGNPFARVVDREA